MLWQRHIFRTDIATLVVWRADMQPLIGSADFGFDFFRRLEHGQACTGLEYGDQRATLRWDLSEAQSTCPDRAGDDHNQFVVFFFFLLRL